MSTSTPSLAVKIGILRRRLSTADPAALRNESDDFSFASGLNSEELIDAYCLVFDRYDQLCSLALKNNVSMYPKPTDLKSVRCISFKFTPSEREELRTVVFGLICELRTVHDAVYVQLGLTRFYEIEFAVKDLRYPNILNELDQRNESGSTSQADSEQPIAKVRHECIAGVRPVLNASSLQLKMNELGNLFSSLTSIVASTREVIYDSAGEAVDDVEHDVSVLNQWINVFSKLIAVAYSLYFLVTDSFQSKPAYC